MKLPVYTAGSNNNLDRKYLGMLKIKWNQHEVQKESMYVKPLYLVSE